ncbi:MAG: tRNA uridine-5-carboxymethylaminomethyl(34) synthesis enzyme MnmG [Bacilli bacterium]
MEYEIIVVGGGHAGCEASLAASRKNHKTLLVTGDINNIATMPCNPSIGGPAKGIVVREIDALGGEMAKNVDKSFLQIKMLNTKKGPAVQALRAQADKITYPKEMLKTLKQTNNLTILEGMVEDLIIENNLVKGIVLSNNQKILAKAVILTTGTYLKADILVGDTKRRSGPNNQNPSLYLSDNLKKYGFTIQRLKTGTPPRIEKDSIDFTKTKLETGDLKKYSFSYDNIPNYDVNKQIPCHLIYTTPLTHQIIKDNLKKSSMYGGYVSGIGPRYCPSIEDKVVKFADKERHQLFLEPESIYYNDIYLQGFSTSMPYDIQEKMIRSLPGLENCIINKFAYAIEYDAIDPLNINPSLETKIIKNLYTAGQINGTSGYEEAACQGLLAGINASLTLENKEQLILKRNEAYIGVLIDDLVTKGTKEPYRLLTSRAEYRLLLRHDNADLRLTKYGYEVGLISKDRYDKFLLKENNINNLIEQLKTIKITPKAEVKEYFELLKTPVLLDSMTLFDFLKRTEIKINDLKKFINLDYDNEVLEQVEIYAKYEGYIKKSIREAQKLGNLENIKIPLDINYQNIHNLASEALQKLELVRPKTVGQASRISGINPSDISIITIYLKRKYNNE